MHIVQIACPALRIIIINEINPLIIVNIIKKIENRKKKSSYGIRKYKSILERNPIYNYTWTKAKNKN